LDGEILRDDQWERLREFVPGGRKGKRGPRSDGRRFFDVILWLARSGARWRDLPEDRFGPYLLAGRLTDRFGRRGVLVRYVSLGLLAVALLNDVGTPGGWL
jgi:transposase